MNPVELYSRSYLPTDACTIMGFVSTISIISQDVLCQYKVIPAHVSHVYTMCNAFVGRIDYVDIILLAQISSMQKMVNIILCSSEIEEFDLAFNVNFCLSHCTLDQGARCANFEYWFRLSQVCG